MDLSSWMTDLDDSLLETPIVDLAIPGSHDSLTYTIKPCSKMSPDVGPPIQVLNRLFGPLVRRVMYNWCVTQKLTVTEQLNFGIRYFDLRVATKKGDKGFYIVHGLYGDSIDKPLRAIAEFVNNKEGEICIIDFQHFFDFGEDDHSRLVFQLLTMFDGLLCPQPKDIRTLTLKSLQRNNHKIILVYRSCSISEELLWPSCFMPTPWPNTMSPPYLVEFLTVGLYSRSPDTAYVSQCVLTPSRLTVIAAPWSGVHERCATPAATVILPWLKELHKSCSINIAIADFIQDNNAAFPKTVISLNKICKDEF